MREEDIRKIAFRTCEDHYDFLVTTFDIINPPLTCQSYFHFQALPYKICVSVFDDILIYRKY